MSKELNRVQVKPKYSEIKIKSGDSIEKQAQRSEQHYKEREDSHITDHFQGQNMTEIKCMKCGNSSYSFDTTMFLHLEISGTMRKTMDELIENISKPEIIDDFK